MCVKRQLLTWFKYKRKIKQTTKKRKSLSLPFSHMSDSILHNFPFQGISGNVWRHFCCHDSEVLQDGLSEQRFIWPQMSIG